MIGSDNSGINRPWRFWKLPGPLVAGLAGITSTDLTDCLRDRRPTHKDTRPIKRNPYEKYNQIRP